MKSAFQQKDSCEICLNANAIVGCTLNTPGNSVTGSVAAINVFDVLAHSEFFNNYAPMYDQFRIDKVRAKFSSLQFPVTQGNINQNFTVITAIDRNGLDEEQLYNVNQSGSGYWTTNIGKNIETYGSALTNNLSAGSRFEITRYISPSTMQEKSQYVATDTLRAWYNNYDPNTNKFTYTNPTTYANAEPKNPCFLGRCEAVPFKPTYFLGVNAFTTNGLSGSCVFNVEFDICVTFRGVRKSQTV